MIYRVQMETRQVQVVCKEVVLTLTLCMVSETPGVGKDVNVSHARRWLIEDLKNLHVDKEKVETFAWFLEVEDILAKSTMNRSLSPKAGMMTEDANKGKQTSADQTHSSDITQAIQ